MSRPPGYHSFLLRMWQTRDGERLTWCASLERPGTRERRGFATLDQLFDFLKDQTAPQLGKVGTWTGEQAVSGGGQGPLKARSGKEKEGR